MFVFMVLSIILFLITVFIVWGQNYKCKYENTAKYARLLIGFYHYAPIGFNITRVMTTG